jgi:hypothetical protein
VLTEINLLPIRWILVNGQQEKPTKVVHQQFLLQERGLSMDIASINNSQSLIEQAISATKTKNAEMVNTVGSTILTTFGDTVEISEAGLSLSVQAAGESASWDWKPEPIIQGLPLETH